MKRAWWFLLVVGLVCVSLGVTGCGGSDGDDDPAPAAGADGEDGEDGEDGAVVTNTVEATDNNVQIAGTWKGTRQNDDGSSNFTMTLSQSGDALTGAYADGSGFEGTVTGSIDGDDIDLTIQINDAPAPHATPQLWSLTGAVNAAGDEMDATLDEGFAVDAVTASKQ